MRKLLFAPAFGAALALLAVPAYADAVNNLTISALPNPVPQSQSNPCVICATQAQNPAGFGFNNFNSTGNDVSFNLFSSSITGQFGNGDDINVTPYTSGFLRSFLLGALDPSLTFGIAIDINTAGGAAGGKETLTEFRLIDLDLVGSGPLGSAVLFDLSGSIALPDIRNGNGAGDYLISGFNLSGVNVGDRLLFQASWDHATDGGESFYLVATPAAVPLPVAGAGLPGLLAAGLALFALNKRRRQLAV
jgi:hypothetical protein